MTAFRQQRPLLPVVLAVLLGAAIVFTAGGAVGATFAPKTVEPTLVPAVTVVREPWPADLEAAFDEGFGAGVEYQTWFCDNEVVIPMTELPPGT